MQALWNVAVFIGLLGLTTGSALAASPMDRDPSVEGNSSRRFNWVAQASSPYQQLVQTRSCVGCNLSNLDLQGLDLSGANLQDANLSNVDFSNSNLRQANLSGANLYLTNFSGSDLSQANFENASAKSANFSAAILKQASFLDTTATYANFSDADFSDASIENSNFSDSNLTAATFANASITATKFNYATLDQSNFGTANVSDSSFNSASTTGATLPSSQPIASNSDGGETDTSVSEDESGTSLEEASDSGTIQTPLMTQFFQQPSAETLPPGSVVGRVGSRFYDLPAGTAGADDTAFYPTFQVSAGVTKDLEISASYQQADSNSPGTQGAFNVNRGGDDPGNDEATISAKYRFWESSDQTIQSSVIGALSFGNRAANFNGNGPAVRFENDNVVPMLQVPVTLKLGDRTRLTLAPTVAFFADSNAMFLFRPPVANQGSFGTTFGIAAAASHEVIPRVSVFGDAFAPFSGNNSVSRASGLPNKEIAFNAGVRFLVNPRLGLDLFASNSQGTLGPLALTTQSGDLGIGANLVFMPNLFAGNRKIADNYGSDPNAPDSPLTVDGIGFFDGGTLPQNKLGLHVQGGSQGVMTALRYGFLKDFEGSLYLNYVLGNTDESEQGIGAKIRLLNQDKGAPVTASIQGTLGQTNEPFLNFINNDPNQFTNSGLEKTVPLILNRDDGGTGRLFVVTLSLPIQYKIDKKAAVWLTPMLGYVQRDGLEAGGINAGGSLEVLKDVNVVAEVGADLIGKGNSFSGGRLQDRIPWTVAVRWDPSSLLGYDKSMSLARPNVELYLTNRVGSSVWQQMRVREGGDPAVGVGIFVPF